MYLISLIFLLCLVLAVMQYRKGEGDLHAFDVEATTVLKGLLAVGIVLHHVEAHVFLGKYPLFSQLANWGLWIVVLFFFITGYGLQYSIEHKGRAYLNGFLTHRMGRVLVPLLVATGVYCICNYLITNRIGGVSESLHCRIHGLPIRWRYTTWRSMSYNESPVDNAWRNC